MKASLLCRVRPGSTSTFRVEGGEVVIGRDRGLGVTLPLEGVSRRHARITWDGRSHWIEDLESTNGTFLNGQPVVRDRLRHLDVVTLGKQTDLLFILRGEEAAVRRVGVVRATLTRDAPDALPYEVGMGEATIGRSSVCNVVAEHGSVSKIHARLERTAEQLVLQDLGSSNGTFVNGAQVMTAILRDGDVITLAGAESYRVAVEMGEVLSSGAYPAPAPSPATEKRPQFSKEWRTRFEWDSGELAEIADVQRRVEEREATIIPPRRKSDVTPPLPKPVLKPPPSAAPARPAAPSTTAPAPAAPARPSPPPAAAAPSAAAPPPAPLEAPSRPVAAPPPSAAPAPAAPPRLVAEVRLSGSGFEISATAAGAHELGRAKEAALRVNHPTVSRHHARIIIGGDRTTVYVEHAGGSNGTRLNGVELEDRRPLSDGDKIGIGEVELKVSIKRA